MKLVSRPNFGVLKQLEPLRDAGSGYCFGRISTHVNGRIDPCFLIRLVAW